MKTTAFALLFLLTLLGTNLSAQQHTHYSDSHGNTLNLGLGIGGYGGYYGYYGRSLPVFSINYEFGVANNFTLAPFATFVTYHDYYNNYGYRETIIPLGVKGTYYFDDALGAGADWDFYLAGSLGFSVVKTSWDDGYRGESSYHGADPLFLDLHIGTEYHLSNKVGLFLDLSTGVSTVGLAFH
jgi:hypothetical protein